MSLTLFLHCSYLCSIFLAPLLAVRLAFMRRAISGWTGKAAAGDAASHTRGSKRSNPPAAGGAPGDAAFRWRGFARLKITARTRLATGLASPSPTSPRQAEEQTPTADGIAALRDRLAVLQAVSPAVVADEFQRELDVLRREIDVTRREIDLTRRTCAMSA